MGTPMSWSIEGKRVLITGATDGIGKQTALELVRRGASVILHGRDYQRATAAAVDITASTHGARVSTVGADLSRLDRVRTLAAQILKRETRLDVLINNAGVYMTERVLTPDGLETTFAVNHLAHFLLTNLLLDLLKKSAPSRIITVSSAAHRRAQFDPANLQGEKSFDGYWSYALSKLANVLFTMELAGRLEGTGVTATCLHPGSIDTKLSRAGFPASLGGSLVRGAQTSVYLAVSPEVEGINGVYFCDMKPAAPSPLAVDAGVRRQLWETSERLSEFSHAAGGVRA
jgi:NAD(P)-dependent dehydrogenase (short-subunit alcohol dehydrogenase family)